MNSREKIVFTEPSEARLLDSHNDSESATDNTVFEHNENEKVLATISSGSGDISQFSDEVDRHGEKLDCHSSGNAESDETKLLDSIEEEIAVISNEIENMLSLSRSKSQPATENYAQVRQHNPAPSFPEKILIMRSA